LDSRQEFKGPAKKHRTDDRLSEVIADELLNDGFDINGL
jgi:hypothetical protein